MKKKEDVFTLQSRRDILRLAGVGVATTAAGVWPLRAGADEPKESFTNPEIRRSVDGILATSVRIQETAITFGGTSYPGALTYNGRLPGPVLQVSAGDTIELDVINDFSEIGNVHFHGLHVTPTGNSDNIFLQIAPQTTQHYTLKIPKDHAGGLCWFHPHMHHLAQKQLDRGLAAFIHIVADHHTQAPFIDMQKRFISFAHLQYDDKGQIDPDPLAGPLIFKAANLINGDLMPTMVLNPGESQYWLMGNTSGTYWFYVTLDGHKFTVIAEDGNPVVAPYQTDKLLVTPGKRFEVVVTASATPGTYTFKALDYQVDGMFVDVGSDLATVIVSGTPREPAALPQMIKPLVDLRKLPIARRRTIVLTEEGVGATPAGGIPGGPPPGNPPPGGPPPGGFTFDDSVFKFFIDGIQYDPAVVGTTVVLGDVEEWTIQNNSESHHPFHLHVNPMMVTRINGIDVEVRGYQDTAQANGFGSITFLVQFNDHVGKTVYHCHNVFHEDRGMMAIVEVIGA